MKRPTIRLFALAALLLPLLGLAPSTSDTFQAIHVERNAFLDERGQPIVFRGVNVYDPLKLSSQSFFEEKYFKEAASWGANIVRQCVHPKTWSSTEQKIALGTLEQAITWAAESGIYSIIDWHSIGMPTRNLFENEMHVTTTDATIAFWKLMARTYKGDKRVAFYELFNEPSLLDSSSPPGAWIELRDWNEKVIDAIREIDPDKPIIVTGLDWGYNLKEVKGNPVRRKNLAYSAHPYPMKGLGWDEYFGFLKNDVAFINTEFGFDNQDSMLNEQSYTKNGGRGRYRDEIIKYFEQNKMSWVAWSFTLDWKPALFAGRDFKPTESGAFVKETLLRLNKGPTQPKTDAAKYVHADLLSDLKKANDVDSSNKSFKKKAFALSSESDQLLPEKAVDGLSDPLILRRQVVEIRG